MTHTTEKKIGHIKWFDAKKGYGFVTDCVSKEDVFVHHSSITVKTDCWKTLYPGEYVSYNMDENSTKSQAANVTGVLDGPLLCETRHSISQQRKEYKEKTVVDENVDTTTSS